MRARGWEAGENCGEDLGSAAGKKGGWRVGPRRQRQRALAGVAELGADRWARGRGEGEGDALGRAERRGLRALARGRPGSGLGRWRARGLRQRGEWGCGPSVLAGPRARKGWADHGAGRDGAGPSAGRDWAGGFGLEKGK